MFTKHELSQKLKKLPKVKIGKTFIVLAKEVQEKVHPFLSHFLSSAEPLKKVGTACSFRKP